MKKFTAEQARESMPTRFNVMIERIHNCIRDIAINGGSIATVTFSSDCDVEGLLLKVKDFLEKEEGYEVILTHGTKSVGFCINWRDDKKFW